MPSAGSDGARRALIAAIHGYRVLVRPMLGGGCRFTPTCSEYAIQALDSRGVVDAVRLAGRRIARCHPWNAGGFDPVPSKEF